MIKNQQKVRGIDVQASMRRASTKGSNEFELRRVARDRQLTERVRVFEPMRAARHRKWKLDGLSFEYEYEKKEFDRMNFEMIIKEYFETNARSFSIETKEFENELNGTST